MRHGLLLPLLAATACSLPNEPPPGELVKSQQARITADAPAEDVARAVDDTTTFAFDVYAKLAGGAGNLAFSPYSLTTALSMTYPGAKGATKEAFEHTLHLSLSPEKYHRAMNTLDRAIESRGRTGDDPFRLRSNNQIFADRTLTLLPAYLDVLAVEYGAGVRLLDFATRAEAARAEINDWVAINTEQLIPELLAQGTITSDTRLTLVNTLYFNAHWKKQFDAGKTTSAPFTRGDGTTAQVPMMAGEDLAIRWAKVGDVEAVELPYQGDEVSMLVLVPPAGKLAELERSLDGAKLRAYASALTDRTAGVRMPRFEARTEARLDEVLRQLGLGVAFSGDADFSGMTAERGLAITAVVHEAVVKTDEAGTEAAAATAVVVGRVSLPEYIDVDRAFVYVIRDRATGAALFLGRVTAP